MKNYCCIKFKQRNSEQSLETCIFSAPVGELLNWVTIPSLSPERKDGIQRARNDFRVRGITKFMVEDERNIIPTAIVIALSNDVFKISNDVVTGLHTLEIDESKSAEALVIDGQHRLYGMNAYNPNTVVPVVAILGASTDEKAFQFIVINNKVSKVSPDHIRALTINCSDQELETRLRSARLSLSRQVSYVGWANEVEGSPFKGLLSLPDIAEENRWIIPASIESSIAYIQSKNMRAIEDEDMLLDFFLTLWNAIKKNWGNAFSKDCKLLSKVGLTCMNQFVVDAIEFIVNYSEEEIDLSNEEDVTKCVEKVLKTQQEDFWLATWTITISDTRSVRDQITDAMKQIQQNIKYKSQWATDVNLIDKSA
ncbi:DGQHR domain-containing protein [Candidatus Nitrotoga sp. HW29]|uniref:DGQHR domain-containing protein n=1 Tax=Candidatus Nitrotoga sp. HW29 TaxID=2886963 RepID=UPI000E3973F5|nr:DGQHR domain-containing protein [Candidatus Nitrotoga sp. HW29]RFC31744.1 MAG: DGQHR domain-containing protein [Candidatus Nitrotoga sp. SPKER]CAH1905042.1 DGQHR domain-containing protein [Candidatus Nitrotoga sp. HW29]